MSWIAIVKAALPLVPDFIKVAKPYFTKKPADTELTLQMLEAQILELQTAVTTNAEAVQELSNDLRDTVQGLRDGADAMQATLHRIYLTAMAAIGVSIVATALALFSLLKIVG